MSNNGCRGVYNGQTWWLTLKIDYKHLSEAIWDILKHFEFSQTQVSATILCFTGPPDMPCTIHFRNSIFNVVRTFWDSYILQWISSLDSLWNTRGYPSVPYCAHHSCRFHSGSTGTMILRQAHGLAPDANSVFWSTGRHMHTAHASAVQSMI